MWLDDETYQTFVRATKAERRSLANLADPTTPRWRRLPRGRSWQSGPRRAPEMPESAKAGSSPPSRIFESRQFSNDLARFGPAVPVRLKAGLRHYVCPALRQDPYWGPNIKRLRSWEPPTWRYGVAEWRFFYEVDESVYSNPRARQLARRGWIRRAPVSGRAAGMSHSIAS
jgi:mRNA interferase RelE/StbE